MIDVYVHGVAALTEWADARHSLDEFIFAGVTAALADAGRPMADMDSIVLAAHDLVDGRSLSSMVTAPAAGAYMRDEIRLCEDGLAALSLAALRIAAGESEWGVVAAWGRSSEGDYGRISQASFDPFFGQPFGINDFSVSTLRASGWQMLHGQPDPGASIRRTSQAQANPRRANRQDAAVGESDPFRHEADGPYICDCVTAVIVGSVPSPIRIAGIGHGTDFPAIGDRDLLALSALRQAAIAAGVGDRKFPLYELDGATLSDEAIAVEALGIAEPGSGFSAYARDQRINPSGGAAAGWAFPTNGLRRLIEACLQLRGTAGAVQLPGRPNAAFVSGYSPVGSQIATVALLEAA